MSLEPPGTRRRLVDEGCFVWQVPKARTKNKQPHRLVLPLEVIAIIGSQIAGEAQ
jgi:hypothetical protein